MLSEDATDASFIVFSFIWSNLEPASDYTSDHSQVRIQGEGGARGAPPLKLEKICFFGVKS